MADAISAASPEQCQRLWAERQRRRRERGEEEEEHRSEPFVVHSPLAEGASTTFGLLPLHPASASPTSSPSLPPLQVSASTVSELSSLLTSASFLFDHSDSLDLTAQQAQLLLSHDVDGERNADNAAAAVGAAVGDADRDGEKAARATSLRLWNDTLSKEEEQQQMKEQLGLDSLRFDLPALPLPDLTDILAEVEHITAATRQPQAEEEMGEEQQRTTFAASLAAVEPATLALPAPNGLLVDEEQLFTPPPIFTDALKPRLPPMPTLPPTVSPSSLPPMPALPSSLVYATTPFRAPPRYCASLSPPTEVLPGAALFHFPSSMEGVPERTKALQEVLRTLTATSASLVPRVFAYTGDDPRKWEQPPLQPALLVNKGRVRSQMADVPPLPSGAPQGAKLARLLPQRGTRSKGANTTTVNTATKQPATASKLHNRNS